MLWQFENVQTFALPESDDRLNINSRWAETSTSLFTLNFISKFGVKAVKVFENDRKFLWNYLIRPNLDETSHMFM